MGEEEGGGGSFCFGYSIAMYSDFICISLSQIFMQEVVSVYTKSFIVGHSKTLSHFIRGLS